MCANQIKATVQHFSVVLFFMLWKVVIVFQSVDEILNSEYSQESYQLSGNIVWCYL